MATAVGTAAAAAGWSWAIILVAHFVAASALSKVGKGAKAGLLESIAEKGDERDGWQVLANGGLFALAALVHIVSGSNTWYAIGAGALAVSAADTWATEIGTVLGGKPVSIVSRRQVPIGTSGGMTLAGSVAGLAGALFIAALATFARWPVAFAAVALGGVLGAVADSVVGATAQSRRWCDACDAGTERRVHHCGADTRRAGGWSWLDNDGVNAISSAVGALITLVLQ